MTAEISKITLPNSSSYNFKDADARKGTVEYIRGTWAAASGTWTGVSKDSELYDGKKIILFMPFDGSGNATLNLTLSGGGTTGAKNVYFESTTRFTTHRGQYSQITLIYHEALTIGSNTYEGWWYLSNKDATDSLVKSFDADSSNKNVKIAINAKEACSISFVITVIKTNSVSDKAQRYLFNGACDSNGIWSMTQASVISITDLLTSTSNTIDFYELFTCGYDSAFNLWLMLGHDTYGSNFTIRIESAIYNGKMIDNYYDLFGVSRISSATGTTQTSVKKYDPLRKSYISIYYCSCNTASNVAEKVVSLRSGIMKDTFELVDGVVIAFRSNNTNTANNPTFNVGGTGAFPVYYNSKITSSNLDKAGTEGVLLMYIFLSERWYCIGGAFQ